MIRDDSLQSDRGSGLTRLADLLLYVDLVGVSRACGGWTASALTFIDQGKREKHARPCTSMA